MYCVLVNYGILLHIIPNTTTDAYTWIVYLFCSFLPLLTEVIVVTATLRCRVFL